MRGPLGPSPSASCSYGGTSLTCKENHASNEHQGEKRAELAEVFEEVPGEQGVFWNQEVVDERAEKDDQP